MSYPILYKISKTGAKVQWQIFIVLDYYYTISGQVGGVLTPSSLTYCIGKNIGKNNETSDSAQCELEATAKHIKKLESGYSESIHNEEKSFFEPMLASTFEKYSDLLFTVPTYVQPKLDGVRCISENNTLKTRNGKDIVSCPHLYQNTTMLDGELYNHKYKEDFNKIISLVKKTKPTEEDFAETKDKMQMWVYDSPSVKGVFFTRFSAIREVLPVAFNNSIKLVPTYNITTIEELHFWHQEFLNRGYEGTIIRLDLGDYENKRSKQLIKYKDFIDEEFEIIGFEEGTGGRANTVGSFWVRMDKDLPYIISDNAKLRKNCCKSSVKGTLEYTTKLWKNAQSYVGKTATVKFFGYTPAGVLRFPYVIKIDREDYE